MDGSFGDPIVGIECVFNGRRDERFILPEMMRNSRVWGYGYDAVFIFLNDIDPSDPAVDGVFSGEPGVLDLVTTIVVDGCELGKISMLPAVIARSTTGLRRCDPDVDIVMARPQDSRVVPGEWRDPGVMFGTSNGGEGVV